MQNVSLHFTRSIFDDFLSQACAKVKAIKAIKAINHPTTLGFSFFIFCFFAFLFSLLPIFLLQLLAFYQARNTCHGQAKGFLPKL